LCPGSRHVENSIIDIYSNSIEVRTYSGGERRIQRDPAKEVLERAFSELGTHKAVAAAFGVSRAVVGKWLSKNGMKVISRPEVGAANYVRRLMCKDEDRRIVARWLVDEGSVSVRYLGKTNLTSLIVCGSMNDFDALSPIASILGVPITCSRSPSGTVLPLGMVKVHAAKAYALLGLIQDHLVGLKAMEARAALFFFPPSGSLRGRHTTDEFLVEVWKQFARESLHQWNSRRRVKQPDRVLEELATSWVEGRIRRARRFVDASDRSMGRTFSCESSRLGE
jgi:hypothetical protein